MSDRRLPASVVTALLVAALVACGDEGVTVTASAPDARTIAVATPPVVSQPATVAPAIVSYEDAESAYRGGNFRDAMTLFAAYSDRRPENAWGHYMLGLSSWKAGEPERAIEAFDRALALDSTHVKSLLNSSRALLDVRRPDEALTRVERALTIDSTSAEALRLLARVYENQGDHEAAISAYQRTLTADERDVWAMNNLGLIFIELDRPEEAIGPLARAVELRGNAPVFRNNLGIALERTGHPQAALEQYEAALAADSTYGKAAVSAQRVLPLVEQAPADTVDLGLAASTFVVTVRSWAEPVATIE